MRNRNRNNEKGGYEKVINYYSLKISNISERTKESDLYELCGHFGKIKRVFVVKDSITKKSRGFAFVTFYKKEDTKEALSLDRYGYDNLILKVEYSYDKC